jgi:pyruvate formate lyase activating enzyme
MDGNREGLIFQINSCAAHDEAGPHSFVFFKGCPLRCLWCGHPEAQGAGAGLLWDSERCQGCGQCLSACPGGALRVARDGDPELEPARCDGCGACADACADEALQVMGRWFSVEQVLAEVPLAPRGRLTLSGGEPLAQPNFAAELLGRYKREAPGGTTVLATCGEAPWWHIEPLAADVDLFRYDLRHMDPAEHLRLTGRSNERILENARRLAEEGHGLRLRLPLVPGVNDSLVNLAATAAFVRSLPGQDRLDLVPYRRAGVDHPQRLDRAARRSPDPAFGPDRTGWARDFLERQGLTVGMDG